MGMTKFASSDDPGFLAVCGELRRWIKQISTAAARDENPRPPGPRNVSHDGPGGLGGPESRAPSCMQNPDIA